MPSDTSSEILNLPVSELTPIVRNVLDDSSAEIEPGWPVEPVEGTHFDLRTDAILRVSGAARAGGGLTCWSAVVKAMELSPAPTDYLGFVDPAREVSTYTSGLFDDLSAAFCPAKLCGLTDRFLPFADEARELAEKV